MEDDRHDQTDAEFSSQQNSKNDITKIRSLLTRQLKVNETLDKKSDEMEDRQKRLLRVLESSIFPFPETPNLSNRQRQSHCGIEKGTQTFPRRRLRQWEDRHTPEIHPLSFSGLCIPDSKK
jgi:hypothetical protein